MSANVSQAAAQQGCCGNFLNGVSEWGSWGAEKISNGVSYSIDVAKDLGSKTYETSMPYLEKIGEWFKEHLDMVISFTAGAAVITGIYFLYQFITSPTSPAPQNAAQQQAAPTTTAAPQHTTQPVTRTNA